MLSASGLVFLLVNPTTSASAATRLNLGTAESFGVLAGTSITNTGITNITGTAGSDLGVSLAGTIVGFPPGVAGAKHVGDTTEIAAKAALVAAMTDSLTRVATPIPSLELGAVTLTPGVYSLGAAALNGTLSLNGQGDPKAVFIFNVASLTTANASVIDLINGTQPCNVFWRVGTSASLGNTSVFSGQLMADTSITVGSGAFVHGSLLAHSGAVTLASNAITNNACDAPIATGTIHVVEVVINDDLGKLTPADFNLSVKHWGVDVAGSPATGVGGVGRTYVLPVGSYVVAGEIVPGYTGDMSGVGIIDGHIMLTAGQDITIVRTNNDWPVYRGVVETPAPTVTPDPNTTPDPTTTTGGTLPSTSSPWFNLLGASGLLILLGALGFQSRRRFE